MLDTPYLLLYNYFMKICKLCEIELDISKFRSTYNKKYKKSYLKSYCRKCESKKAGEYRKRISVERRDEYLKSKKLEYNRNKQNYIKYRNKTKEHRSILNRNWKRENRAHCTYKENIRRAKKLKATPKWLTSNQKTEIYKIYKECNLKSKTEGVRYSVDHILPLQGKNVSGLHVPWNLQIITLEENSKKGNRV